MKLPRNGPLKQVTAPPMEEVQSFKRRLDGSLTAIKEVIVHHEAKLPVFGLGWDQSRSYSDHASESI